MTQQPAGQITPLTVLECYLIGYMRRFGCIYSKRIPDLAYALNLSPTTIIQALKRLIRLRMVRVSVLKVVQ
jgi:hypothetical protein